MDRINSLSDEIICHILSFLAFKEAASTSVLSKRWRNLFTFRSNLHLDDQEIGGGQRFIDFVDRVLAVSGSFPIRKISIKCRTSIEKAHVTRWMSDVLKHGVFDLDIDVISEDSAILVPVEIFTCKALVHLKLTKGFAALVPEDVSLPSLKTLFLDTIVFSSIDYCVLEKLLSACPVLEELTILGGGWQVRKHCRNVSSLSLKRLTLNCNDDYEYDYWDTTFNTPSLAYLDYSDSVPNAYPVVNLESLVEAKLHFFDLDPDYSDPTNLIKGLSNVEVLELSSGDTWNTFVDFSEAIPVFSNLIRLSVTVASTLYNWELLSILLEKSPNLHTLVIKGPLCVDEIEREYGSSCPVKVLKITEYGGTVEELLQMSYFLEKLPCLELVKVRAFAINEEAKSRIIKLLLALDRSSKCNIQIKFQEETK